MAILLEGPHGAPVIWGKLGDYVIQRTGTGKLSIRRYKKPSNPKTPAQQMNRDAMKAGISRWGAHERHQEKEYWDLIARRFDFRDGYRAFLSSYMTLYHLKVKELGDSAGALAFVSNITNRISYLKSPLKEGKSQRDERLNRAVFLYQRAGDYHRLLESSLSYLRMRGSLNVIPYSLLPQADPYLAPPLESLGLLPPT